MPKNTQSVTEEVPRHLVFELEYLKVEFADVGAGVAVIVPEWGKQAVVLTYHELKKLHSMIGAVLARP